MVLTVEAKTGFFFCQPVASIEASLDSTLLFSCSSALDIASALGFLVPTCCPFVEERRPGPCRDDTTNACGV